jgi:alpha-galactosidase
MAIQFDPLSRVVALHGKQSTYAFWAAPDGELAHLHWGGRVPDLSPELRSLARSGWQNPLDAAAREYPDFGRGDNRTPAYLVCDPAGHRISRLRYRDHVIEVGKPALAGLPAIYVEPNATADAHTIRIRLDDPEIGLEVELLYTILPELDAVCRSARLRNCGQQPLSLRGAASFAVDLPIASYRMLQLSGSWARERHEVWRDVHPGALHIESRFGASGHEHNPFIALARNQAGEVHGEVYGLALVYSGSFRAEIEQGQAGHVRATMGINPFAFEWQLAPADEFHTPECVGVYSSEGLRGMSQRFHELFGRHLCRGPWRDRPRPVVLNTWEAVYFKVNTETVEDIADAAAEMGVELLVVDDGWFGDKYPRNDDTSSLGDWVANPRKLPEGVAGLAPRVHRRGLRFGLWVEPEMVNPNSALYQAHPDWCLHVPGRDRTEQRNQLILDMSRADVRQYVTDSLCTLLDGAAIDYIKWDMNRNFTEAGSSSLPAGRQGEVHHRYILGVYEVLEHLVGRYPELLIETCSGGGGRFDAGLLFYGPQTWTSDNTDGGCRLDIQAGTARVYPAITMGAHVSAVPNHQVGRSTSLAFRLHVAMAGNFGFELDPRAMTADERQLARAGTAIYKEIRHLVHNGRYFQLASPFASNWPAWMFVDRRGDEAVVFAFQKHARVSEAAPRLRLAGLDAERRFRVQQVRADKSVASSWELSGAALMQVGLELQFPGDYASHLLRIRAVGSAS